MKTDSQTEKQTSSRRAKDTVFDHLQCHKSSAKDRVFPCVCVLLYTERKSDTPAALQTLCSYIASFFTPCQTPLSPLLTEEQPPFNPFSSKHIEEGLKRKKKNNPTISHIVLSPSHVTSQDHPQRTNNNSRVTNISKHHVGYIERSMWKNQM